MKEAQKENQMLDLDKMLDAYIKCALWSSTDRHGIPLDENYSPDDLSKAARDQIWEDCESFLHEYYDMIKQYEGKSPEAQAGHDFWLTRNRHGAGFWDSSWPDDIRDNSGKTLREELTVMALAYGPCVLVINDDGEVECIPCGVFPLN